MKSASDHEQRTRNEEKQCKSHFNIVTEQPSKLRRTIVVISSGLCLFFTIGWINAAGIFFVTFTETFDVSSSQAALIGALQNGVSFLLSPLVSLVLEKVSCRLVLATGGLIYSAGYICSFFTRSFTELLFTMGLLPGIGGAGAVLTTITIVSRYFGKRRALAISLALLGPGLGTMVLPHAVQALINEFSWKGACLIIGGLHLHVIPLALLLEEAPSYSHAKKRKKSQKCDSTGHSIQRVSASLNAGFDGIFYQHDSCTLTNMVKLPTEDSQETSTKHSDNKTRLQNYSVEHQPENVGSNSNKPDTYSNPDDQQVIAIAPKDTVSRSQINTEDFSNHANGGATNISKKMFFQDKGHADEHSDHIRDENTCQKLKTVVKSGRLILFVLHNVIFFSGANAVYHYLPAHAVELGYEKTNVTWLITTVGLFTLVGTPVWGHLADIQYLKRHLTVVYVAAISACGLAFILEPYCVSFPLLVLFAAVVGFTISANYTLSAPLVIHYISLQHMNISLGLVFLTEGIGKLIGPPFTGLIYDATGSYPVAMRACGGVIFLAVTVLVLQQLLHRLRCSKN